MNVSYLEKHLKAGGEFPSTIVDEQDIYKYKRDKRACKTLNKVLDTEYKAVYRRELCNTTQWSARNLTIETGDVFIVKKDNTVISLRNSEWFRINQIEAHTYG